MHSLHRLVCNRCTSEEFPASACSLSARQLDVQKYIQIYSSICLIQAHTVWVSIAFALTQFRRERVMWPYILMTVACRYVAVTNCTGSIYRWCTQSRNYIASASKQPAGYTPPTYSYIYFIFFQQNLHQVYNIYLRLNSSRPIEYINRLIVLSPEYFLSIHRTQLSHKRVKY